MGKFTFDSMKNNTVGGAILGGILGSTIGDSTAEKVVGGIAGAIIGDYVSDEIEARNEREVIVVHQPRQKESQPYYYQTSSSYFDTLKCELDRESLLILNSCVPNQNKRSSLRALKERVNNAFYGHKISYNEMNELEAFVDSRIKLCEW
jgi:hypothetical protein